MGNFASGAEGTVVWGSAFTVLTFSLVCHSEPRLVGAKNLRSWLLLSAS